MTIKRLLKNKGAYVPSTPLHATVRDVIKKLDLDDAGALVVTDDDQRILGLISERNIVRALQIHGTAAVDLPVHQVMSQVVHSCDVNEPLSNVLELMDRHQIHHVPITANGNLCGIINMLDVVKYRLEEIHNEAEALKAYVAGSR